MEVNGISAFDGAKMFIPQSQTQRPSPSAQEEMNLKALDQTEISVSQLRDNYSKAVT
jgi:hypothetical protein